MKFSTILFFIVVLVVILFFQNYEGFVNASGWSGNTIYIVIGVVVGIFIVSGLIRMVMEARSNIA